MCKNFFFGAPIRYWCQLDENRWIASPIILKYVSPVGEKGTFVKFGAQMHRVNSAQWARSSESFLLRFFFFFSIFFLTDGLQLEQVENE